MRPEIVDSPVLDDRSHDFLQFIKVHRVVTFKDQVADNLLANMIANS